MAEGWKAGEALISQRSALADRDQNLSGSDAGDERVLEGWGVVKDESPWAGPKSFVFDAR
jgi:hypothetical protein